MSSLHHHVLCRSRSLPRSAFSNVDVVLTMPSGTTVCDIQVLTVWCQRFNAFFAQVTVDKSQVFVSLQRVWRVNVYLFCVVLALR